MVFMVHDSDPNVAKTCFVHVKSGGQIVFFDPHLKKWWVSYPADPMLLQSIAMICPSRS